MHIVIFFLVDFSVYFFISIFVPYTHSSLVSITLAICVFTPLKKLPTTIGVWQSTGDHAEVQQGTTKPGAPPGHRCWAAWQSECPDGCKRDMYDYDCSHCRSWDAAPAESPQTRIADTLVCVHNKAWQQRCQSCSRYPGWDWSRPIVCYRSSTAETHTNPPGSPCTLLSGAADVLPRGPVLLPSRVV